VPLESKKPLVVCPRCGRLGRREIFRRYLPNGRVLEYVRVYHGKVKKVDQTGRAYWSADVCHLGPRHLYGVVPESWGKPGAGRGVPLPVRLMHITNLESIHFPTVIDRAVRLLSQVADFSKPYPEVLGRWAEQLAEIAENFDAVRDYAAMKAEEVRLHLLLARGEAARGPRVEAEPLPIKLPGVRETGLRELTEDELRLLRITKGLTALGPQDEFALKKKVQWVASLARRGLLPEPKREEVPLLEEEKEKEGEMPAEAAAGATAARAPSQKASGR